MTSDLNSQEGIGINFGADRSLEDEGNSATRPNGKSGAFANFFEEFEQQSDGMSQGSINNRNWQDMMRSNMGQDALNDLVDGQPCLQPTAVWDIDSSLMYMDNYGMLLPSP